ncbi:uvrD/REP helicase N-terminal domain protein [Orientia chuto str. Dubai]|uniref:DNA 3'-5' helicase n=1 Tax=Orientia chuto str. Dubai TaxID=1359168 RepID=A0A0F3ML72_9RICK|nr:UvrD-helicase domain-containing protein [Candidatus Orientia mediorientalis]KJV56197.1 uvrD/REP helicase N-terminal domain protein [Orientia chuto str. Dubai]
MNQYLLNLNLKQREAVTTTNGPLLVLAGAGTGKTRVITYRIAYIIDQLIAAPEEILAVTFTNKAAIEMQARVAEITNNAKGVWIGTFHSIATKILKAHAELVGLTSSFTIIDQSEQVRVIKQLCERNGISIKNYSPKDIVEIISRWKDLGNQSKINCSIPIHYVAQQLYQYYQAELIKSNLVDFGDLLLYNMKIFNENPDLLNFYQKKFKYVFVDEYQDTNSIQYFWAKALVNLHENLCCVGDDDQSIYSWRGANIENILKFKDDFKGAKIIKLEQNYRSTNNILTAASNIICNNKHRHDKKLWTTQSLNTPIKIVYCYNDREEARFISAEIKRLKTPGLSIAVLVRSSTQTHILEESFFCNNIKYQVIGGFRFFDRMEIADIIAYLRVVINHNDNLALTRIINIPKRSIGPATLNTIKEYAQQKNISIFAAIEQVLSKNLFKTQLGLILQNLINKFKEWHFLYKSGYTPAQVTEIVCKESNYLQMLKDDKSSQSNNRIENIQEMIRSMLDYSSIEEFLEHASLFLEREDDNINSKSNDVISLMTLHASKGLEFDIVFLPGWEEGVFPHQKSLIAEDQKALEEERRVAYVGITRAKQSLYISYADQRRIFNEFVKLQPSRFLLDIPTDISLITTSMEHYDSNNHYSKKSLSVATSMIHNNSQSEVLSELFPGAKVIHKQFGQGTVIRVINDNIEVAFHVCGIKTIKQKFLTIKK